MAREADREGAVRVPVRLERAGVGSLNEILTEQAGGRWSNVPVTRSERAGDAVLPPPEPDRTWIWLLAGAVVALLAGQAFLAIRRCRATTGSQCVSKRTKAIARRTGRCDPDGRHAAARRRAGGPQRLRPLLAATVAAG